MKNNKEQLKQAIKDALLHVHPDELTEALETIVDEYIHYVLRDKDRYGNDDTDANILIVQELITALK